MSHARLAIKPWLDRLNAAAEALPGTVRFMEVCGTHTMEAFRCGLRSLLPARVVLLSGPGCPVCVTAQGDIDALIEMGHRPGDVTVCTYGDMLRVPGRRGSLESARAGGADIRVVYSVMDAVRVAAEEPGRQVVFAAVGFETTAPATAAGVLAARSQGLGNFSVFVSHKLVVPAMLALLAGGVRVAGFMCPGHVSVIIGARAYETIPRRHRLPCVVTGFEPVQMAAGLTHLTEQVRDGRAELENLYPEAVAPEGNPTARGVLDRVFQADDAVWRGLGMVPGSGLRLREEFRCFDAADRFGLRSQTAPEPVGCRCGDVLTGRVTPHDCVLFGTRCTPVSPVGPCMVSSEGSCQASFKYDRRRRGDGGASRPTSEDGASAGSERREMPETR